MSCKHQKKSCTILAGGELQGFNKQSRTQKIEEEKNERKKPKVQSMTPTRHLHRTSTVLHFTTTPLRLIT